MDSWTYKDADGLAWEHPNVAEADPKQIEPFRRAHEYRPRIIFVKEKRRSRLDDLDMYGEYSVSPDFWM